MLNTTLYAKTPLAQIGRVVAWHEDRANRSTGAEARRHRSIAKEIRSLVTSLFVERFYRGEYAE